MGDYIGAPSNPKRYEAWIWQNSHSHYGKKHTDETKAKMSASKLGENAPWYGKHLSEEHRRKLSDAHRGKHLSWRTRKKMSEVQKRIGNRPPLTKGPLDLEHRRKISESLRGNQNAKGRELSKETRRKISESLMGHPPFGQGRAKGSYCRKGHWVRSSWERIYADWLFSNGIPYRYEPEKFQLGIHNGKPLYYLPDFYLPLTDTWVEIKGVMRRKNRIQHRRFRDRGYTLLVLDGSGWSEFLSYAREGSR